MANGPTPTPAPTGVPQSALDEYSRLFGGGGFVTGEESTNALDFDIPGRVPRGGTEPAAPNEAAEQARVQNNLQPSTGLFKNESLQNYRTVQWGPTRPGVPDGGITTMESRMSGPGYYTVESMWEPVADNWSRERVIRLQAALAGTGLLTGFTAGIWDNTSAAAFQKVLGYANDTNQSYHAAIKELASAPAGTVDDLLSATDDARESRQAAIDAAKNRMPFIGDTYLAPDADNVRTNIRNMITSTVGRGYIDEAWVEKLTQDFMSDFRANFEQQQRIAREKFEVQQTAQLAAQTGLSKKKINKLGGGDLPTSITEEEAEVDVEGNLQTELESRLDPIAGSIEERQRAETANQSVFNVFGAMSALGGQ